MKYIYTHQKSDFHALRELYLLFIKAFNSLISSTLPRNIPYRIPVKDSSSSPASNSYFEYPILLNTRSTASLKIRSHSSGSQTVFVHSN